MGTGNGGIASVEFNGSDKVVFDNGDLSAATISINGTLPTSGTLTVAEGITLAPDQAITVNGVDTALGAVFFVDGVGYTAALSESGVFTVEVSDIPGIVYIDSDYTGTEVGYGYDKFASLDELNQTYVGYGGTICCHVFRQEETEYIRRIIAEKETGYAAEGIRNRLVVCHINFSQKHNPPFDIEYDTYGEWCRLIREEIKPDAILNGHEHKEYVVPADSEGDLLHPGCPVIVGGIPVRQQGNRTYSGTALVLSPGKIAIRYTDDQKNIKSEAMI